MISLLSSNVKSKTFKDKRSPSFYTRSLVTLFYELENANNPENKIKILKEYKYKKLLKKLLQLIYNPLMNLTSENLQLRYSVCEFRNKYKKADETLKKFLNVYSKLHLVVVKEIHITHILSGLTKNEYNLYCKFLDKRLGLSYAIIDEVFPNLTLQLKKFMKCGQYDPSFMLEFPIVAEPYLKGIKIKLVCSGDVTQAYSRFKDYTCEYEKYLKVLQRISKKIDKIIDVDIVVTTNDNLQQQIYVIDFVISGSNKSYLSRKKQVKKYVALLNNEDLEAFYLRNIKIKNYLQLNNTYKLFISRGYNSIILKDPLSVYIRSLSVLWLRYKDIFITKAKVVSTLKTNSEILIINHGGTKKTISVRGSCLDFVKATKTVVGCTCIIESNEKSSKLIDIS